MLSLGITPPSGHRPKNGDRNALLHPPDQAIFPGPYGMEMTSMRTCCQCGTSTGSYVECCRMVLCADYTDPRCCAERHFGNHTWCELCLMAGERSLATQQHYWHGAFAHVECREVDLCQECAEQVGHILEPLHTRAIRTARLILANVSARVGKND